MADNKKPLGDELDTKEFICGKVAGGQSQHLSQSVADQFGISRQSAQKHIKQLIKEGVLEKSGQTKGVSYKLAIIAEEEKIYQLIPGITEDLPWRDFVRPLLGDLPSNIISICQYGFTEMFNNAIEHSNGNTVLVSVQLTAYNVKMWVSDDGIGIFRKIAKDFNLDDERHAIFELAKGKLTSDPARHSGEGIFFTSRMFDRFGILSDKLIFTHTSHDWLFEEEKPINKGTSVVMEINTSSTRTTKSIFEEYATIDHPGFYKTIIPLKLAKYGDENMVSRSQAKRVLTRVEKFTEVVLDFKDVNEIGQGFADEIFRVFAQEHPNVHLMSVNTNESVDWMIKRAKATGDSGQPSLFEDV